MKLSKKFSKKIKSKAAVLLCAITAICTIVVADKVVNKQNSLVQYIAKGISTLTDTIGSETPSTTSEVQKDRVDICVSTTGNDETGDGTKDKPYATLAKAINMAGSGQSIYVMAGTYKLKPMTLSSYTEPGIYDQGKALEIFGDNEKTILEYDGSETTKRDGAAFQITNKNTLVRNLTYVYYPKSGSNYQRSIFRWCDGRVENVFFRICGANSAAYLYYNGGGSLRVKNCTFFHDTGSFEERYSGSATFTNIATNVATDGTEKNVIVDSFGTKETELADLINNSKTNENFTENSAGVYYGEYSWNNSHNLFFIKDYKLNYRNTFIKIGETLKTEIIDPTGENIKQSDWTWTSSNEDVATVDSKGNVVGKGLGHATITAYNQKTGYKAKAIVNVYRNKEGAITTPQIEEGEGFTLILKEDGTVWAVGRNDIGTCAQGDTTNRTTPVQIKINASTYLTNVVKIAAIRAQAMALTSDGEVYTWGYNDYGVLGLGDTTTRTYATKVKGVGGNGYLENIIDISIGHTTAIVVDKNGDLYAWGNGQDYELLENETSYTPVKLSKISNFICANVGYGVIGAIKANGETWTWGYNKYGEIGYAPITTTSSTETCLSNEINEIKFNGYSGYILKEDGTIWSSGLNNYGQLGLGDTTNRTTFTQIKDKDGNVLKAKTIKAGSRNLQFIGTDGKTYVTGYNGKGQIGDQTTTSAKYPKVMTYEDGTEVTDAIAIAPGTCYSDSNSRNNVILRKDGSIWIAGENTYGQIGNGTTSNSNKLIKMGEENVQLNARNEYIKIGDTLDIDIQEIEKFNVFIPEKTNQSDWTWTSSNEDVATVNSNGVVTGTGIGYTTITAYNSKENLKGKVIINVYNNKEGAITKPQVEVALDSTIILKEDGTVWTTGRNHYGQLGNGTTTDSNKPVQVKIDENTYLTNVRKISTSNYYTVALTTNGEVYAWGDNGSEQLGQGNSKVLYATKIKNQDGTGPLQNIVDVIANHSNTLYLDNDGGLYICGYTDTTLYLGKTASTKGVTYLGQQNAIKITGGYRTVGIVTSSGKAIAWGKNSYGVLGNGTTTDNIIGKTTIGEDIDDFKLTCYSGMFLKDNGKAYSAGLNNYGQLGIGNTTSKSTYTEISLDTESKIKYIAPGGNTSAIMTSDGKVYETGYNKKGQLSDGTTTNSNKFKLLLNNDNTEVTDALVIPEKIGDATNVIHTLFALIRKDGSIWTVGENTYGQLGNGTTLNATYLTNVGADEVKLNVRNEYIKIGNKLEIKATEGERINAFIQDSSNKGSWTWTSLNEDVATIDNNGIVTGKTIGYTTITGYNTKTAATAKAIINVYSNKEGAITRPQIEVGPEYTIILKEDGTVWATGKNDCGQLGNGTTTNSNKPVQVKIDENTYLTNVRKISTSNLFTVALTTNGEAYAWGYNPKGQLGQGTTSNVLYATKVKNQDGTGYVQNIIDVIANHSDTMYLDKDGGIYMCGYSNSTLFLGQTESTKGVTYLGQKNAIKITGGYYNAGLITASGKAIAWGQNDYGAFGNGTTSNNETLIGENINDFKLAAYGSVILRENGKAYITGYNGNGQLGIGNTTTQTKFTEISIDTKAKIKYVTTGGNNSAVMTSDGKVYVTGYNAKGHLSNGTTTNSTKFIPLLNNDNTEVTDALVMPEKILDSDTAYYPSVFSIIKKDGTVWSAGNNTYGQLGNATNVSSKYLTQTGEAEVELNIKNEYIKIGDTTDIKVTSASMFSAFTKEKINQNDWTWKSSNEDVATIDENGTVTGKTIGYTTITGYNTKKGLKAKAIINVYRNKEGVVTKPQVEVGPDYSVILKEDGTVWATGRNDYGQLGNGTTTNSNKPVQVKIDENTYLTNIRKISATDTCVVALATNGEVYAWGRNNYRQLGQGDTTNCLYAKKVKNEDGTGYIQNIIDVIANNSNTVYLDKNGGLYICGYSSNGIFLEKTPSTKGVTYLGQKNAIKITGGYINVGLITTTGKAVAWGQNDYGTFGAGNTSTKETIVAYDVNDFKIACYGSIVLKEDGKAYAAGKNSYGQLGIGNTTNTSTLTQISIDTNSKIKYIAPGGDTSAVMTSDGTVYETGYNYYGVLSNGTTTNSSKFMPLLNNDGSSVTDGFIIPEKIIDSSTDFYPTIFSIIRKDGTVWTSGNNEYGQLGNSTNINSKYLTQTGTTNAELNAKNEYIKIGETLDVDVLNEYSFNIFISEKISQSDWTWTSSNEDVATVDNKGIVTGKQIGYTTITGYNSKTGVKAKAIINVYSNRTGAITVPIVGQGYGNTITLKEDGTVWATGKNDYGQLGIGDTINRNTSLQVKIDENTYLENVKKIDVTDDTTIALTKTGEVYAWGRNYYGELGVGDKNVRSYATRVKGIDGNGYLENIIDVANGEGNSYAIDKNGNVYGWGHGGYNQIDDTSTSKVYPTKMSDCTDAISISAGDCFMAVMQSNSNTLERGYNRYGQRGNGTTADTPTGTCIVGNDINKICAGNDSTLIIKEDGTVWTSGRNQYGELGVGDTSDRTKFTKLTLEDGTEIKAKYGELNANITTILGKDGKVYATGYNEYGQLSNGTTTNSKKLKPMLNSDGTEVTDAMLIKVGEMSDPDINTGIIKKDGTIWVSGNNTYGQIGNGTTSSAKYFTQVGINDVQLNAKNEYIKIGEKFDIDVISAANFNVFVKEKPVQSDWKWSSSNEDVATVDENGVVTGKTLGYTTIIGYNSKNGLKAKAIVNVYRNQEGAITVPVVGQGYGNTITLKEDGTVWATGKNDYGQLGVGDTTNRNTSVQVKIDENTYLENVIKIDVTDNTTIALTKTGEVYAWGKNEFGELGLGDRTYRSYATRVKGIDGNGYLENIIDVANGDENSYAIDKNGNVYGWGDGNYHQIDDTTTSRTTPTQMSDCTDAISVSAGDCFMAFIQANSNSCVRGYNRYGQRGNGTTADTPTGACIVGNDINKICAGNDSTLIIKEDGTVWTSGRNQYGELGVGDTSNRTTYTKLTLEDGTEIKAKYGELNSNITTILGKDGKVYATGYNGYGQLSNGTTTNSLKLKPMLNEDGTEVTDAILIKTGEMSDTDRNTGIVRKDGTVWVSGDNTYGQIGNSGNTSATYLSKMGDGFLNYPEKVITVGVDKSQKINPLLFNIQDDMNVYTDSTTKVGTLNYEIEDSNVAELTTLGMITGKQQGITKIKVTDTSTKRTTSIWVKVVNDSNIQVSLGYKFSVALKQDGTVWSWGQNNDGELGLGNTTEYSEPQQITDIKEKITDVKTGYYHSIALTEKGEVYTWGYNGNGQLGNGTREDSLVPVKVTGLENIAKVNAYKYMTIALTQNGEVYAWGSGYGAKPVKLNFTRKIIDVSGNLVLAENRKAYNLDETKSYGKDLIKVVAGYNHYLGLTSDGEVYAWGSNSYGQLGNGNNTSSSTAVKVVTPDGKSNMTNIVDISAGDSYSIITDKDGKVYTFGYYGDYRTANTVHSNKPVEIQDLYKTELVVASEGGHTAIVDWDGNVYTVGLNDYGQLGLKDTTTRSKFEKIGELEISCEPARITLNVGESKDISLALSSSFNLKNNKQASGEVNKTIENETIASLAGNTVTGNAIGKTMLNATYEGIIGTLNTQIQKFNKNVEVEVLPKNGKVTPKVEAGDGFTVELKADGTVWSHGQNQYGQLGVGDTNSYNEPQKVKIIKNTIKNEDGSKTEIEDTIKDISVGNYHVLALSETGKVYAWGYGEKGQLGTGSGYSNEEPVVVKDIYRKQLQDIVKVEAGENVSFAITSKGKVYAWGNGYSSRAQLLDLPENAVDITSKYVLTGDGKVYNISTKEQLPIVGKIVDLDEGTNHTVMLTNDGKAYAIGDNTYGQLSNGNNVPSETTPVAVRKNSENIFTGIKEIKAGDKTTVIVTTDGKLYACGMNDNNELGIENKEILDVNTPQENKNIENVIFANIGTNHVVAIKEDGEVDAFGYGKNGELGSRNDKNSIIPVMVGKDIIRTNTNNVTLKVNQGTTIEGYVDYFNIFNNDIKNINYTSKDTSVATLEDIQENDVNDETQNESKKFKIRLSGKKTGTTIVTANQENTDNIGVIQVEVVPETENEITISPNVITNGSHTISLRTDGKVFTWGDNTYGQLGNGTVKTSDEPVEVTFPEGTIITQIAAGENHNVALDSNGNVWTWGRNNNYQIGNTRANQYTPYKVSNLPKVIKISAGNNNTMVITENNELYAWGLNAYGDLGLGTYTNKVLPKKVKGIHDIIDISGGKSHYIALNRAGEVFVTGSNLYGQLGIGDNEIGKINEFQKVEIKDKIGTIDAGDISNIATTVDGYVYTWGGNTYSTLGTGDKENKNVPTKLKDVKNIRQASTGKTHTILRDGNNNVYVTGTNSNGQLGLGTTENKTTFEQNTLINNVIRVSAGDTYIAFLKEDGSVWACGDYNHGDKEKKSRTKSEEPVLVGSDTSSLDTMEIVIVKSEVQSILANAKFKFNLIYIEQNDKSDFEYTSYNNDIAKIDEDGNMLGIREGTTWAKVKDKKTGKESVAIIRVVDNNIEYNTHVAPNAVSGKNYALGLKEDGTIWTWGYDASGLADSNVPVSTNVISTYNSISAGKNFALATRKDGTAWAIGSNNYGQLGIGSYESKAKLVQIEGLTDITSISAGETHSIALDSYGTVYGWGSNANGELSSKYIGKDTSKPVVISMPRDTIIQISAGKGESAFVTTNGQVYGMGKILNGYIPGVTNAVKVEVGTNYLLILRADGTIYKYQDGKLSQVSNIKNAIDISVQNNVNMYQSVDEKAYTWGENINGQLGLNSTEEVSNPTQVLENGTNVFRIGAGYNNTFIISNTGFIYSAGDNKRGELGNGTSENDQSTTKYNSLVHTLVGDRNFEIDPENNTLEINEIEDINIKAKTFNVFGDKNKELDEYKWDAENTAILSILENGKVQGASLGTTQLIVTDKVTGEEKKGTRAVVPVDTDRIESITATGAEAEVTEAFKYKAKVPVDEDTTKSQVQIKTKLGTDQISIDNGATWEKGIITKEIDILNNETEVPFIVKTEAGNEVNYTLTIVRVSNDNSIKNVTIQKADIGAEEQITENESKIYETIVPSTGENVVKVTTNHEKAYVSIDGQAKEEHEQTYTFEMEEPVKEIPLKITSESGKEETYTLKVYTKEYLATLNKVMVNGKEATKIDDKNYEAVITDEIDLASIEATTNFTTSKIGINNGEKQQNAIKENIQTVSDVTSATIQVESEDGTKQNEYKLTIKKQRTNSKIQELQVEGKTIKEINNVYTAYVSTGVNNAMVKITTKNAEDTISLADFTEEKSTLEKSVEVNAETNAYKIQIKNNETGRNEKYTLIIKRGDTEVGLKDIFAVNETTIREAEKVEDTKYEIRVLSTYTSTNLTINCINTESKIAVGQDNIDAGNYQIGTSTQTISLTEKETTVPVKVITADGGKEKEYTVNIIRSSDDAELNEVAINELLGNNDIPAEISKTEENTYEVQLQNAVTSLKIKATAVNENTNVKIGEDEYSLKEATKEITLDSSLTEAIITVKTEYGTEKQYTLKINTLPAETGLKEVTVGNESASYNSIKGRYEIKVDNELSSYDIIAKSTDDLANITLGIKAGDVTKVGTVEATENKSGKETIVPITVTAQNGIESSSYDLAIIEKSSIANIGTVQVNGQEIEPDENGNYTANVKSTITDAEIRVESQNDNAKVTVDSETQDTNQVTIKRKITEDKTEYTIKVVSEDGKNTEEKSLTISRLSGNTNILSIKVEAEDKTEYEPTVQEDGTYHTKTKRTETANITVTTEDEKAKISIASGEKNVGNNTSTVTLLDEITEVNILIEAEDGTTKTAILKIEKESNNTDIAEIKGENIKKVSKITSSTYEVQVDDRLQTLAIDAITKDENAKIKLGTETEYTPNKIENKSIDISQIKSFTIDVLAEDGETTKTYTIEITKKFSTELAEIKTDGDVAKLQDNSEIIYNGWVDADDTANIEITPDNALAKVSVYKDNELIISQTGTITLTQNIKYETDSYKIIVSNPNKEAETSTYILNITKKSTNNNVEYVKVNGETLTENKDTQTYETQVITVDSEKYELQVKAENEYATIKFDEGEYSTENIQTQEYEIEPKETKEVKVTVKSQNGEEIIKTVKIYRKDNNLNVENVKVNGTDITSTYDEKHKNYNITLENTLTTTTLEIVAESEKTEINTTIDEVEHNGQKTIIVDNINLPGVGKKTITFTVTSEEGKKETRTITISQFSSDIELEKIQVRGKDAKKRDDGNYEITIGDVPTYVDIYAKAQEETTSIEINGGTSSVGEQQATIQNIEEGQYLEVPVKLTAADGTEYEYQLYITVKSGDNNVGTIRVNNLEATKIDDKTYRSFVQESAVQATVDVTAKSELSNIKVTVGDSQKTGNPLNFIQTLPEEKTNVTITIASEAGEEEQYTLEIIKESSDNSLKNVYVNGIELEKDKKTGRYRTTVEDNKKPVIKAISNNQYAYVRIALNEEEQTQSEKTVELGEDKITVIPITIRSQTGITNVEYIELEKIDKSTAVDSLIVDDVEITDYDKETNTYKAVVDKDIDQHEIFIMAGNTNSTIEINENTAVGSITTYSTLEEGQDGKTIPFTITSETGTTQKYQLLLIKKSSNVNVTQVVVNDVKILPDQDRPDIYRKNIKKLANKAKIKVTTEYPYASVKIGDNDTIMNESEAWIDLKLEQDEITVPVVVTATDGKTVETYNIILQRLSNDTSAIVSYDGEPLSKDENGKYNVSILDTATSGTIKVVTNDANATADINNTLEYELGGKEYNLDIDTKSAGKTIEVPISVVSADETVENSTLVITRLSTNNNTAKVEGTYEDNNKQITKEAVIDENGNYFIMAKEETSEVTLKITPESQYSTVKLGDQTSTGELTTVATLTGDITYVNYTITSEAGEEKQYTIKIGKIASISGKILTENTEEKYKSTIKLYKSTDTSNPVKQMETEEDGTFNITIEESGKYDLVACKDGYLNYKVTGIEVIKGEETILDEHKLIAGNVVKNSEESTLEEQIEIDDLVALNNNYGEIITDEDKVTRAIYDLNEDGVVNKLDRDILKKNYGKKAETIEWVNPNNATRRLMISSSIKTTSEQSFILPITCSYTITSNYGTRKHPTTGIVKKHTGIDIAGTHHTEILAVADGEVTFAGVQNGFGNCIEIKHIVNGETIYSFYAHLSKINVKSGDKVKQGEVIGLEGGDPESDPNPGNSTGHHLHFEIRKASGYGNDVDPTNYIKF